ncbi:hypothetical protein JXA88_06120 [Candidatus Fermentibacteria bacterium]|nr:hypothetical protein [Candidatus Fermentibacteria bacterium]
MIKVRADSKEIAAAHLVAQVAQLESIDIVQVTMSSRLHRLARSAQQELNLRARHSVGDYLIVEPQRLVVEVGAELAVERTSPSSQPADSKPESIPDPEGPDVSIRVIAALSYRLPPPPIPDEVVKKGLPAFARLNAVYNAWPFIRQEIHHLAMGIGLPVVVPLLQIVPTGEQKSTHMVAEGKKAATRKPREGGGKRAIARGE